MRCFNSKNKIIPIIIFIILFLFCFVAAQGVMADEYGLDITAGEGYGKAGDTTPPSNIPTDVSITIGKVVGAGLAFIGILFFILMIYGGFLWMTARGNEQEVEKAKDLIYAAVIGLIIVLAAYAITAYIGGALTT